MTAPVYGLVVPGDWWRLDLTTPDRGRAQVRRLVRRLAGTADAHARLRRELVEHVDAMCADAAGRGGVDLYLSTGGPSGTLVAASLLVAVLPRPGGAEEAVPAVSAALREDGGAVVVEIGSHRAVRRARQVQPDALAPDGRRSLVVQYAFVLPEVVVLLSFSTPVLALADPLTGLFDAVAETFRWHRDAA